MERVLEPPDNKNADGKCLVLYELLVRLIIDHLLEFTNHTSRNIENDLALVWPLLGSQVWQDKQLFLTVRSGSPLCGNNRAKYCPI